MSVKAQAGSGGALVGIILVVIIIAVVYLYFEGYIHLPTGVQSTNVSSGPTPITLSAKGVGQTTNLYAGEPFQVISSVTNTRNSKLTVSLLPYGCSTILQSAVSRTVPGGVPVSILWNFTAPSSGECQVQFTACFSYTSYSNYPITVENSNIANAPLTYPSFSNSPVDISIQDFNSTVIAPPYAAYPNGINRTEYIMAGNVGTGSLSNSTLDWLDISSTGKAYLQLSSGVTAISGNFNITKSSYAQNLYFSSGFTLPFFLTIPPVTNSRGYSAEILNISAGYTYCIQSNPVSVSVS